MKAVRVLIKGRVQNPNFSFLIRDRALSRSIFGHFLNKANGDVEIILQGDEKKVDEVKTYLRQPPSPVIIKEIYSEDVDFDENLEKFEIKYERS